MAVRWIVLYRNDPTVKCVKLLMELPHEYKLMISPCAIVIETSLGSRAEELEKRENIVSLNMKGAIVRKSFRGSHFLRSVFRRFF